MSTYDVKAGLAEVREFHVIGVSTITNKQNGAEDINALWERFFKESIGQQIPNKIDDTIYAVYSDYQGDHEAPYRLTIGYRVNSPIAPANDDAATAAAPNAKPNAEQNTPAALSAHDAPPNTSSPPRLHYVKCISGEYAVMSAAGEQPKALIETWTAIWSSDLDRSFKTDFEIYGPRFFEDGINEVLVHIGIKNT